MVFLFQFVYMVDHVDRFSYVKLSLQPQPYLVMVDDFSDVFLDSGCQYFIEYFCISVHGGNWTVVLFFSCVFVWLVYQGDYSLIKRVW